MREISPRLRTAGLDHVLLVGRQVEMSHDIDIVVPVLIANFVAKLVADMISKPLYKYQLDIKSLPYLDPELTIALDGHL